MDGLCHPWPGRVYGLNRRRSYLRNRCRLGQRPDHPTDSPSHPLRFGKSGRDEETYGLIGQSGESRAHAEKAFSPAVGSAHPLLHGICPAPGPSKNVAGLVHEHVSGRLARTRDSNSRGREPGSLRNHLCRRSHHPVGLRHFATHKRALIPSWNCGLSGPNDRIAMQESPSRRERPIELLPEVSAMRRAQQSRPIPKSLMQVHPGFPELRRGATRQLPAQALRVL